MDACTKIQIMKCLNTTVSSFQGRTIISTTMARFDVFYHFDAFRYKSLFSGLLMVPVLGMEGRKSRGCERMMEDKEEGWVGITTA